jgi:hypothetical protein
MNQETLEQTFSVTSPVMLQVSNIRGSVDIQSGEEGTINIVAIKDLDSGDAKKTDIVISQDKQGGVQVKTKFNHNGTWFFHNVKPCKVDYTIRVPGDCSLSLTSVSNTTTVSGVNGAISIKSVSGPVKFSEIEGNISVDTVSGSFNGESLTGSLKLDAVSGITNILDSRLERISISTVSGDCSLNTSLGSGPYRFNSISGNVNLKLPLDSNYTIHTNSIGGRVKTSQPSLNAFIKRGKKIIGNGGGVLISHNSISGDLYVDSGTPPVKHDNFNDKSAQNNPDDRMQILDRIESGEISVEDALKSLEKV